jgi:hypothetical protein
MISNLRQIQLMPQKSSILIRAGLHLVLSIFLFSLWAAFALLIINPYLSDNLPGYTVGRLCIWEAIAGIIAFGFARIVITRWGFPETKESNGKKLIVFNIKYIWFFLIYLFIALGIGIWKFMEFSSGY